MATQAPWHRITDPLPRFATAPPHLLACPPPPRRSQTGLWDVAGGHGSCLCGGVVYTVRGPLDVIQHCHGWRDRKMTGAPHDSCLLAAASAVSALPIPRVVELGEALSGYYAISERVFGGYIDDVDESQMRAVLPSLFAALDATRRAALAGTTGYGAWGADGTAPYPSWRERLAASSVGIGPFEEAYGHLQAALAGRLEVRHLIHSDLLHANVLVTGDRVTGVLDWGCGMYGDFLYDLAWPCFWQPWYPAWQHIDFREEATRHYAAIGLDVPDCEARLRCCLIHIGLAGQAYMAYAGHWTDLEDTAQRTLDVAT